MPSLRYLLLLLAGVLLLASPATAQTCTPIEIAWPDSDDPIWELTALPPSLSTPAWRGSGLEIRDVHYRGISVLKRGHVPMINVKYDNGTCFRDWANSNTVFEADNSTGLCFAEPAAGTSQTVCDLGVGFPDFGSFQGIAMEDFGDGFTLITHSQAGWYRYTIKWTFEIDGTIRPEFGFSHTPSSMANNSRRHHIYWRLDFDIDTPENNYAAISEGGQLWQRIDTETTQLWAGPDESGFPTHWAVFNHETARGYRIAPGEKEYETPANPETGNPDLDNFAREDIAFSRYRPGQLVDGAPGCSVDFHYGSDPVIQHEDITSADIVVWYRTGATREGGNGPDAPDTCKPLGPILQPIGNWAPDPPIGTEAERESAPIAVEAFPNPLDQSTTIRFTLADHQHVRVSVFDGLGREVRVLLDDLGRAGANELMLEAGGLPSGIYTVRVSAEDGATATRRIVVVR